MTRVMVLDDAAVRHDAFDRVFASGSIEHAWTYWDAVALLKSEAFDIVYLDHDLNEFESVSTVAGMYGEVELTGMDVMRYICRELDEKMRPPKIIVHSWNAGPAQAMVQLARNCGIIATYEPFQSPD